MKNETILSGNPAELTPALKDCVAGKTEKLFRHEAQIVRLRGDLAIETPKNDDRLFKARGMISINRPHLVASETSNDTHHLIDVMAQRLDRMLRNRAKDHARK